MKKAILLLVLLVAAGCSQHGDMPAPLSITEPQKPSNVVATNAGSGDYDLSWEIGNAATVDHYNVYLVDPFTGPDKIGETTTTSFLVAFGLDLGSVTFGVSVVSTENVEGETVFATAE